MTIIFYFLLALTVFVLAAIIVALSARLRSDRRFEPPTPSKENMSGIWMRCEIHGNIALTKSHQKVQDNKGSYYCPWCGRMPIRIWRDIRDAA